LPIREDLSTRELRALARRWSKGLVGSIGDLLGVDLADQDIP